MNMDMAITMSSYGGACCCGLHSQSLLIKDLMTAMNAQQRTETHTHNYNIYVNMLPYRNPNLLKIRMPHGYVILTVFPLKNWPLLVTISIFIGLKQFEERFRLRWMVHILTMHHLTMSRYSLAVYQIQISLLSYPPGCKEIPCLCEAHGVHSIHDNDRYNDKYKTTGWCKHCSAIWSSAKRNNYNALME